MQVRRVHTVPALVYRLGCAVMALLLFGASTVSANESVRDLRYGVTLFHFFQQDYFDALTELGAAQQMNKLPHHGQEAELLRGGMSLSYGMDREARRVFDALLEQAPDDIDADRAWFYLGKLAWRRGDEAATASALARMDPQYTGPLADEGHYLRAMQALANGEDERAIAALRAMQGSCPFKPYYFYNLGSGLARSGDWANAAQAFRQVTRLGCVDEEGAALRDKAHTAAGFASLAAGNSNQAVADFLAVRLHGPEADRALLGYGWSHANAGNYDAALVPWQALNARSLSSGSVRESLLAVPYAYEQLQRPATALTLYQQAAEQYADTGRRVDAAVTELRDGDLLTLFGLDTLADPQWLGGEDPQPQGEYAPFLLHLLSTDTVQLALRELYDLGDMQRKLTIAQERLAVLKQVDSEQRQHWSETIDGGGAEALASRRELLLQQSADLRRRLDSAIASGNGRLLATPDQAARWQRIERAAQRARALNQADAQDQLRLMQGLMQWSDNEAFPERRWRLMRDMQQLEALAAESSVAYSAVTSAMQNSARPVFEQHINNLAQRVDIQADVVAAAVDSAQTRLRTVAVAELEQQRDHLRHSEGQALLAVARLYDLASQEVPR